VRLYRHFDKDGVLLYVGVSLSVVQRLAQHRDHAHWFERITRVEMQASASRDEALAAERAAIQLERPLFNIQHSRLPKPEPVERPAPCPAPWVLTRIQELLEIERSENAEAFWSWRKIRRAN